MKWLSLRNYILEATSTFAQISLFRNKIHMQNPEQKYDPNKAIGVRLEHALDDKIYWLLFDRSEPAPIDSGKSHKYESNAGNNAAACSPDVVYGAVRNGPIVFGNSVVHKCTHIHFIIVPLQQCIFTVRASSRSAGVLQLFDGLPQTCVTRHCSHPLFVVCHRRRRRIWCQQCPHDLCKYIW